MTPEFMVIHSLRLLDIAILSLLNYFAKDKLAKSYTIREGYVDYLSCFRNYLNEMISVMPANFSEYTLKQAHPVRSKVGVHPWDFAYNRDAVVHSKPQAPYWQTAKNLKLVRHIFALLKTLF